METLSSPSSPSRIPVAEPARRLASFQRLVFLILLLLCHDKHVCCFAVNGRTGAGFLHRQETLQPRRPKRLPSGSSTTTTNNNNVPLALSSSSLSSDANMDENEDGDDNSSSSSSSDHDEKTHVRGGAKAAVVDPGMWPRFDELDMRLIKISLPVIANFAINPLIGAVDLFWVNRMGNALAVAGQAAANQVFNSAFWVTSFLPSVTATLIAKEKAMGHEKGVQDSVCQALFVGIFIALATSTLLLSQPNQVLSSVLADGAPAMEYARPYLLVRSFAFVPSLISLVGFSAFRGVLDTVTPVKISLFANLFNALLDPILIFNAGMGVTGAALATLAAELVSAVTYLILLRRKKMLSFRKLIKLPAWAKLEPLIRGGAALQLRNVALNVTFLAVARVTQGIDSSGVAAAAHAMAIQVFQLGGIVLLALSTVSQTVIPNDMVERYDESLKRRIGGRVYARWTMNRLMTWGLLLGTILGSLQLLLLPAIQKSTPLQSVRDASKAPAILASVYQVINGMVFIGEGVMLGSGSFMQLSLSTVVATAGCLWALRTLPPLYGLTGVWYSFGVFNVLRLIGVYLHQRINGPLAPKNIEKGST